MKLSSKSRYGLKAMCVLAEQEDKNEILSNSMIAKEVYVTEKYLEQIITILKKANLVEATRGQQGGYKLSRSASEISIGEIIRPLEGDLKIIDCLDSNCVNHSRCKAYDIWFKLYKEINNCLDSITLKELINKEV